MLPTIVTSPALPIDDDQLFHDRLFGRMATSAWRGCDRCRWIALETALPERACLEPPRRKSATYGGSKPADCSRSQRPSRRAGG
jgi:hypothetical protein